MRSIAVKEAFAKAPPRRPAVLCKRGPGNSTVLIATQWFTWLNFKHNPMLSCALERRDDISLELTNGEMLVLAFPPIQDVEHYRKGVRVTNGNENAELPEGVALSRAPGIPVAIPRDSEVILCCALANSYRYPFKKVRICNCNLEEAMKEDVSHDSGSDQPSASV